MPVVDVATLQLDIDSAPLLTGQRQASDALQKLTKEFESTEKQSGAVFTALTQVRIGLSQLSRGDVGGLPNLAKAAQIFRGETDHSKTAVKALDASLKILGDTTTTGSQLFTQFKQSLNDAFTGNSKSAQQLRQDFEALGIDLVKAAASPERAFLGLLQTLGRTKTGTLDAARGVAILQGNTAEVEGAAIAAGRSLNLMGAGMSGAAVAGLGLAAALAGGVVVALVATAAAVKTTVALAEKMVETARLVGTDSADDFAEFRKQVESAGFTVTKLDRALSGDLVKAADQVKGATEGLFIDLIRTSGPSLAELLRSVAQLLKDIEPLTIVVGNALTRAFDGAKAVVDEFHNSLKLLSDFLVNPIVATIRVAIIAGAASFPRATTGLLAQGPVGFVTGLVGDLLTPTGKEPPADLKPPPFSGKGKSGHSDADALRRAQTEEAERAAKREYDAVKAGLDNQEKLVEQFYDKGKVFLDDYYDARIEIIRKRQDAEDLLLTQKAAALAADLANATKESEKVKIGTKLADVTAEFNLGNKKTEFEVAALNQERVARKTADNAAANDALDRAIKQILADYDEASGLTLPQAEAELRKQEQTLKDLIEATGQTTDAFGGLFDKLKKTSEIRQARAAYEDFTKRVTDLDREIEILTKGPLSDNERSFYRFQKSALEAATALGYTAEQTEKLIQKMKQLKGAQDADQLRQGVREAFKTGIESALKGDFKGALSGFANALADILRKRIAESVADALEKAVIGPLAGILGKILGIGKGQGGAAADPAVAATETLTGAVIDGDAATVEAISQQTDLLKGPLDDTAESTRQMLSQLEEIANCSCESASLQESASGGGVLKSILNIAGTAIGSIFSGGLSFGKSQGEFGSGYSGAPAGGYYTGAHGVPLRIKDFASPGFLSPGEFGRADPNELFYAPPGGGVQFYGKQSANKQAGTGGAPIYVTVNINGVQDFGGFKRSEDQILSSIGAGISRATQRNG
ncbi:MAG TPA: hypothetical protein VFD58_31650 [Blastocatellia bacterium]|nr:hypothetical protein [Blastocatellia bacterium]